MPANERMRVVGKIETYTKDPAVLANNVSKLQQREGYKLRIGQWRVIFDLDGNIMNILDVGPRGGIYV